MGYEWVVAWRHLARSRQQSPGEGDRNRGQLSVKPIKRRLLPLAIAGLFLAAGVAMLATSTQPLGGVAAINIGLALLFLRWLLGRCSLFSTISIFGVTLGVAAPVVVLSVMSGFETDLHRKVLGQHAHVEVTRPDRAFIDWADTIERIKGAHGVMAATPYLQSEVLVQSGSASAGAEVRGVDEKSVAEVTHLGTSMQAGSWDVLAEPPKVPADGQPPDAPAGAGPNPEKGQGRQNNPLAAKTAPPVILGAELARNLHVYVGDEVTVTCLACNLGPQGIMPRQRAFQVAGLVKTGMYEFDSKLAYVGLGAAQRFLSLPDEITGIEIRLGSQMNSEQVAEEIGRTLGSTYEVKDWRVRNRSLLSALKMEKVAMFVVLGFIVLVASFSIVSNLIMLVVERSQEIAMLKALGATTASVVLIFLYEGLYIGLLGLGAGLFVGLGDCFLLGRISLSLDPEVYYISHLPINIDRVEIVAIAACALGISALATLYPAVLGARLRPVEGLRTA